MKRILVAGVLGGLVLYVWGAFSWMVLPWHNSTMKALPGEGTVSQALAGMNMESGLYVYPQQGDMQMADMDPVEAVGETADKAMKMAKEGTEMATEMGKQMVEEGAEMAEEVMQMAKGGQDEESMAAAAEMVANKEGAMMPSESSTNPYIFMFYVAEGFNPADPAPFIGGLVLAILTASLAAYLLSLAGTSLSSFSQRVTFVALIGVFAALVSHISAWNWMLFPTDYTVVMALDLVLSWVLAGIVIAWRMPAAQDNRQPAVPPSPIVT